MKQQYLPDGMEDAVFYTPTDNGYEKQMGDYLEFLKGLPGEE